MIVYGSFDRHPLTNCELTAFSIDGFLEDASDSQIDEGLYFSLINYVLEGDYSYDFHKKTLSDKLFGGGIYLTIGKKNKGVKDYRCINQKRLKKMYNLGELKTEAYNKK